MTGTVSWILSLKAITDALIGLGVIKGKNCQVKSIVRNGRATVITFAWYNEDEELQEMSFTMYDGVDGINGVDGQDGAPGDPGANGVSVVSAEITATHHLVFTMSNDTTIDAGVISGGGGEGGSDVIANPDLEGDEEELESLGIDGTNYKLATGGTNVIANPILSGDELDLNSLKINNNIFKVSVEKDITAEDYADLPETKNNDDITYFVENEEVDYSPQIINLTRNINTEEIYVGTTEPNPGSGYKVWIDPTQAPEPSSGGGSSLELLWTNTITPENKTINSSYSAAEFTLDVTAYKHVVIDYIFYAPYNNIITCIHPVGQSSRAYYVGWNSTDGDQNLPTDGVIISDRIVVANKTGTTFKFYDCSVQGVTNNKCLIPWRIWGMN